MWSKQGVRLKDESGIAIVFAVQVMAVMSLMVAATLASGVSLGGTTERDLSSKDALGGALSGLDVARYRLNELAPASNMCVTTQAVATGTSGAATGECPAYSGDLGNGTTYGYYITPALVAGATCGGQAVPSSTTAVYRCLTSYGTSNGVTRRTQALAKTESTSTALFPFNGMLALSKININQNSHGSVVGQVATNGTMTLKSCTGTLGSTTTFAPGPTASMSEECAGTPATLPPRSTPWTLDPLDSIYSGTETTNDNATVFGAASGFQYTAAGRTLKDTSNATLIINGANPRTGSGGVWTFNFCKFTLTHVTQIKLMNGATARFLWDSNQRAGSGCGTAADVDMTNVSGLNYDTATGVAGDPSKLQFFFYGTGQINISNQSGISAALYAPDGKLKATNQTKWVGAIAANEIEATNGLDFTAGNVSSISGSSTSSGEYSRTSPGFVECKPALTTATDPESGC